MTAKEEKIREAYGGYWEIVKYFVDQNGFIWEYSIFSKTKNNLLENIECENKLLKYSEVGNSPMFYLRPKSLQGIENNNGWIKIESEDDLPKEGHYWVFTKKGEIIDSPKYSDYEFMFNDNKYWLENFTHYKPIQRPEKPIY